jgi:hypothetical protein
VPDPLAEAREGHADLQDLPGLRENLGLAGREASDMAAPPRNRAFVVEVEPAMVGDPLGGEVGRRGS